MSFAIDVNVLLYASDKGSAKHTEAVSFLQACAAGREVFCLAWLTVMSYLRMATHPSIFQQPLTRVDQIEGDEAGDAHGNLLGYRRSRARPRLPPQDGLFGCLHQRIVRTEKDGKVREVGCLGSAHACRLGGPHSILMLPS